jgi:hypothetical protein
VVILVSRASKSMLVEDKDRLLLVRYLGIRAPFDRSSTRNPDATSCL